MSKAVGEQTSFIGGISFSDKEGVNNSYAFGRGIDHRTDPKSVTLNPRSELQYLTSDLPIWGDRAGSRIYSYGNSGYLYVRENGTFSTIGRVSNSQGNGLKYFNQDKALYYAQNDTFGRILDAATESQTYDDMLGSEGGEPTNTKSLSLNGTTQYASVADNSSLSITSDLSLEIYTKLTELPGENESFTLLSKWDEQSDERSYKLDLLPSTSEFGDGSDGALTIAANTTESPIDANFSCSAGALSITVSNVTGTFAAGQVVLLHQTRGTNAGQYERKTVQSVSGTTITFTEEVVGTYAHSATASDANKAQIRVLKQYTTVTINSGVTYTAKAWDGLKGGIIGWLAQTSTSIAGTLSAAGGDGTVVRNTTGGAGTGGGFRGGNGKSGSLGSLQAFCGESSTGASTAQNTNNGGGGGGGYLRTNTGQLMGGAASYSEVGSLANGADQPALGTHGLPGTTLGDSLLSRLHLGQGGGGGVKDGNNTVSGGGAGGGAVYIFSTSFTVTGAVSANGGSVPESANTGAGAGGSGGSILIKSVTATLGSGLITATGGTGGRGEHVGINHSAGNGSPGRIAIYYSSSYTGTTTPTAAFVQDTSLSATTGYQLRLQISSTGANTESYVADVTDIVDISNWHRWQVTWDASASTAVFYDSGAEIGTSMGALTAIYNSTAVFAVGADFDSSSAAQHFLPALVDDIRVWTDIRTESELIAKNGQVLFGTEANLVAYYKCDGGVTDSQTNVTANDLTASGTPTYSTDIPFSGVTTRADQDQGNTDDTYSGSYSVPTSITETDANRIYFTPAKDPQKSIVLDIDTVGTGTWTVTVHDSLNRTVASASLASSQLVTGNNEFTWSALWRPIIGARYHAHVTSTVNDGVLDVKATQTTLSDGTENYAYFTTHYQFLVADAYHPMEEHLDMLVIGNERYLATYEAGGSYNPHRLTFPSRYRARCFGFWREFIAIGCWSGTSITDSEDGRIFFWDGISDTYNHSIPVPEGGVNALFGTQDVLFIVAGYSGEILIYTGGGAAEKFNKVPQLERDKYIELAPGSLAMWRSMLMLGVGINGDTESVHKGVYSIGTAQRNYPVSLGFDYPTSLGDITSSSAKVGVVYPSGQDLYIGWQNSTQYGIDKVSVTNQPYAEGTLEMLITDLGGMAKEEYPLTLRADFEPLVSGESMRVKYKPDRAANWKTGDYEDTEGAKEVRLRIPELMKEVQVAVDFKTTTTTAPKLLGISLEVEGEQASGRNA